MYGTVLKRYGLFNPHKNNRTLTACTHKCEMMNKVNFFSSFLRKASKEESISDDTVINKIIVNTEKRHI